MVRTLGPRSISSFLKVALDIVFVLAAIALLVIGSFAMLSAIGMANPEFLADLRYRSGPRVGQTILATTPRRAAEVLMMCVSVLGFLGIVGRLRKIFATLIAGDPFRLENARRLRIIGLILAALEAARFGVNALLIWGMNARPRFIDDDISIPTIFAIFVLFVLAEVFEEGVRMKKDLELTI